MDSQHAQRARDHAERGTAGATAFAILDLADAIRAASAQPVPPEPPVPLGTVALERARELAVDYAGYDGEHHKQHALVTIAELLGARVPDGTDRGIPA